MSGPTGGIHPYPAASAAALRMQVDPEELAFVVAAVGEDEEVLFSMVGAFPEGKGGCIEGAVWFKEDDIDDTTGIDDTELVVCC